MSRLLCNSEVFFAYFVNVSKHRNYLFFKRCQVKKNECTTQECNKMETDLRGESPLMPTRRCQDANSTAMYGLSKFFKIKFPFSFQYTEIILIYEFSSYIIMIDGI